MRSAPTTNPPAADSSPSASVAMNWYEPVVEEHRRRCRRTRRNRARCGRQARSTETCRPSRSHRPATTIGPSSGTIAHSAATSPGRRHVVAGVDEQLVDLRAHRIRSRQRVGESPPPTARARRSTDRRERSTSGADGRRRRRGAARVVGAAVRQRSSAACVGGAVGGAVGAGVGGAVGARPSPGWRSSGRGHRRGSTTRWSRSRPGSAPRPARPSAPRRRRRVIQATRPTMPTRSRMPITTSGPPGDGAVGRHPPIPACAAPGRSSAGLLH